MPVATMVYAIGFDAQRAKTGSIGEGDEVAMAAKISKFERRAMVFNHGAAGLRFAPLAIAGVSACIGFAAMMSLTVPAQAQEGVLFKNLMGKLGVVDEDRDPISYHERAPLALPPSTGKLPTPQAPAAKRAENWPEDTDVQKRRRETAERRKPVPFPSDNRPEDGGRLSVYELDRISRRPQEANNNGPARVLGDGRESTWVDPDTLRSTATSGEGKKLDPNYEPKRESLLQPPSGYRKPADGAPMRATRDTPVPFKKDANPERDALYNQD